MNNFEEISCKIEKLRDHMNQLIIQDPDLKDPRILIISRELDELINQFCKRLDSED